MPYNPSLFQDIGGMQAVNIAVNIFYDKLIKDERVKHFFMQIDMETQGAKMKTFLASAFGSPLPYHGKNLTEAHSTMLITKQHYHIVAIHLYETLLELNIAPDLIEQVMQIVSGVEDQIVNHA